MSIVYIGSDHAGLNLKEALVRHLEEKGHTVLDLGPSTAAGCDFPVYAQKVCDKVLEAQREGMEIGGESAIDPGAIPAAFGILICGTGIGMSIAANRIAGIRAALCSCEFQARATRQHNNANVLCLGERVTGPGLALSMSDEFLETSFEGGRHLRRISLMN